MSVNVSSRDATLAILGKTSGDQSAVATGSSYESTGAYSTQVTLSWTGDGSDYLIIARAEGTNDNSSGRIKFKLDDGTTAYGEQGFKPLSTSNYVGWSCSRVFTSLSGSQSFTLEWKREVAGTAEIREAYILALNLSEGFSDYGESHYDSIDATTSTTWTSSNSSLLTAVGFEGADFLVVATALGRCASTGSQIHVKLVDAGTDIIEIDPPPNATSGNDAVHVAAAYIISAPSAGNRTTEWQYKKDSGAGNAVSINAGSIFIGKLSSGRIVTIGGAVSTGADIKISG